MYKIDYDVDLDKVLGKIPKRDAKAIKETIENLSENPRPDGAIKLSGRNGYRVRVGNYCIIYSIFDDKLVILVLDANGRKDVYKKK